MTSTMKSVRVADDQAGGRLDRVLATHIAELSRTRLKALIEAGAVAVDGRTIRDPGHRVNSGAAVQIDIPPPAAAKPAPEPIPLNVVYEDVLPQELRLWPQVAIVIGLSFHPWFRVPWVVPHAPSNSGCACGARSLSCTVQFDWAACRDVRPTCPKATTNGRP
jgi:hypothetical protein